MNSYEDKNYRATAFNMENPEDAAKVKALLQRALEAMEQPEYEALFASVSTVGLMHLRVARLKGNLEKPAHTDFVSPLDDPDHPLHPDMVILGKQSILLVEMFQRLVHEVMRKEKPYEEHPQDGAAQ
jgi:hypothetical protein